MKGTARIISMTAGAGRIAGSRIRTEAAAVGVVRGEAIDALRKTEGNGGRSREAGVLHWMKVMPEQVQEFVWLRPDGVDYNIETSTNLKWKII
jgi:hypothetical protein